MRSIHLAPWHQWLLALALGATLANAAQAQDTEKLPPGTKLLKIEATPAKIDLKNPYAYTQLLFTGHLNNGDQVDVTRMVQIEAPGKLIKVTPRGIVRPVADGAGQLKVSLQGQSVVVPVKVSGQKAQYEVSFVRDVMPVISRMGCNAGTCHGAAAGRNGFGLSLRGYDPLFDHRALTDDISGRRFNRAAPERSLMLLKTSGAVPHGGGVLTQPGEPYYELFKTWVASGVKLDLNSPRVTSIEVLPKNPVIPLFGMKQQLAVMAHYSDGSSRDVSNEAFLESSGKEVASVDAHGLVTAVRRGETAMMARYEGAYAAITLIVMGDRSGFAWKNVPEFNYIDTLVYEKLKQVKVLPSDLCTDSEFIRRLYLDLTGLPPEVDVVRDFLADKRPTRVKRDALVDKLIGSPDYIEHWTNKWADLLQVNRKFLGEPGAKAFRAWIRNAVASNMPYDKFAHTILSASGSNLENPPAAYYKILRDPGTTMENTTHLFLAVRFNCNKCHDHPFERWTQDQYYHLAAFFAQVGRKEDPKYKGQKIPGTDVKGPKSLVEIIYDTGSGEVKHDRTGEVSPPVFPFRHSDMPSAKLPRRLQLAHWVASKDNPYFARSYVNRLWSYLLGVGLIEPIDDIRAGNPPTNPKLLDRLTTEFISSGFDARELIRTICKSRTYQHSIATNKWNQDDEINYAHALARRLPAEVLYDAIHRCTGSLSKLPGLPPGARAAQLLDSNTPVPSGFLELFGRPVRESACECERSSSMMLGPVLNLVNGPIVGDALKDPNSRIAKLLATQKNDEKVIEELFLMYLSRLPTKVEMEATIKELRGNKEEFVKLQEEHKALEAALKAYEGQLPAKQVAWEKEMRTAQWVVLEPKTFESAGGATLKKLPDNSLLASGKNPFPETYTITATTELTGITGIRLEVMADNSLPKKGPGRAGNGNFVLSEFRVAASPARYTFFSSGVGLQNPLATFSQNGFPIRNAIDNNENTGWAIAEQFGRTHTAVFQTKAPVGTPDGSTRLTFTLLQKHAGKDHNIGRLRLSVTTYKGPIKLQIVPDDIAKLLHIAPDKRTNEQKARVTNYFRSLDAELAQHQKALADHAIPPDARAMAAQDIAWALMNSPAFLFNH
jgi:hypothetical protein